MIELVFGMERLVKGYCVCNMVQFIMFKINKFVEMYEDKDRMMEIEIVMFGEIYLFYYCLEEMCECYRKFYFFGYFVDDNDVSEDYIVFVIKEVLVIVFSEEEGLMYKEMEKECERDQEVYVKLRVYYLYWFKNFCEFQYEFKCEICGNQSYKGRRSFKMYFKEV